MPFPFEVSKPIMKGSAGSRFVPDVPVRRRSQANETFTMDPNQATTSPVPAPPGAPTQFFRLNPPTSQQDPNDGRYQISMLVFQGNPEDFHTPFYDPCLQLSQRMQVNGVGPMDLPIHLSCAMHPLEMIVLAVHALKAAAVALGVAVLGHMKSLFRPDKVRTRAPIGEPASGDTKAQRDRFRKAS